MIQAKITLKGVVRKLIDRSIVNEPQQAQIFLTGADHLYDEVRIPNVHQWEVGAAVEVTIRPRTEDLQQVLVDPAQRRSGQEFQRRTSAALPRPGGVSRSGQF